MSFHDIAAACSVVGHSLLSARWPGTLCLTISVTQCLVMTSLEQHWKHTFSPSIRTCSALEASCVIALYKCTVTYYYLQKRKTTLSVCVIDSVEGEWKVCILLSNSRAKFHPSHALLKYQQKSHALQLFCSILTHVYLGLDSQVVSLLRQKGLVQIPAVQ